MSEFVTVPKITEYKGKPCHIFAETLEQGALDQFFDVMDQSFVVAGASLPDAHLGKIMPIGTVVAVDKFIAISYVGVDIGCGMASLKLDVDVEKVKKKADKIFQNIYRDIPVGFNSNKEIDDYLVENVIPELEKLPRTKVVQDLLDKGAYLSLGSMGSGNHFLEIGNDDKGNVFTTVHSGSRNLGYNVCNFYSMLASGSDKPKDGHFGFSTESEEGKAYLLDMNFCLAFALASRKEMLRRVTNVIGCNGDWEDGFVNKNHNTADYVDGLWVIRKGCTSANKDELGLVPANMRDGVICVKGLGNPKSLCSSSHGAGRRHGRKEAERVLDMDKFRKQMEGIVAKVCSETLAEAPGSYKNIDDVMKQQKELVLVTNHIKPIINIKDATETRKKKKDKPIKEHRSE